MARSPLMNDGILNSDSISAVQRFDAAEKIQKLETYLKVLFRIHATKLKGVLDAPIAVRSARMVFGAGRKDGINLAETTALPAQNRLKTKRSTYKGQLFY